MKIRCKMKLIEISSVYWSTGKRLVFQPEYDATIPEDVRFQKATPSGRFEIFVDNAAALASYTLGDFYYFDSTPVTA